MKLNKLFGFVVGAYKVDLKLSLPIWIDPDLIGCYDYHYRMRPLHKPMKDGASVFFRDPYFRSKTPLNRHGHLLCR